jgi:hypothetical protein
MQALTHRFLSTARATQRSANAAKKIQRQPGFHPRLTKSLPVWTQQQKATHYFDAAEQSALTLRTVLRAYRAPGYTLGRIPDEQLMIGAVNTLVASTCPQGGEDSESHAYFALLLNMHLSGLEPEELKSLARALKTSGYDRISDQTAVQCDIYDEFGFASGRPQDVATLPSDWHHLLDDAIEHSAAIVRRPLPGSMPTDMQSRATRQCINQAGLGWSTCDQSMTDIVAIAQQLSEAIGLSPAPRIGTAVRLGQHASMVDWKEDCLELDLQAFRALVDDADGKLLGEVLRDLTELLLTRKMFGVTAHPARLCGADRTRMQKTLQQILSAMPVAPEAALHASAGRVIANVGAMGKVQVLPTVGVALGHAWAGPELSILPDKSEPYVNIGTHYMQPGFRLEPDDCQVRQWPVRWLSANENAAMFPDEHAWQVTVPVERGRLKQAAADVAQEWKEKKLPYRFIGTAHGMPSTGCRASVLKAIESGMDLEARTLFTYFNAGLADPESPTELALRMNDFIHWLQVISTQGDH